MTEEQIQQARYHAARDIAHRWFAFFEGETEEVTDHIDIFSGEVMLVHGGTHLLAKGKTAMSHWLRHLPHEKGSHFIRRIQVIQQTEHEADVNMDIGYQAVRADGEVGGALSEYRTTVSFDDNHNAVFTFLQKTPRHPNPDNVFRDSFAENRLHSFIARLSQVLLLSSDEGIKAILHDATDRVTGCELFSLLKNLKATHIHVEDMDIDGLACSLAISAQERIWTLNLVLTEKAGRYLTIRHAALDLND